ncbi:hypothetical protein [Lysobacter capsici]|uniref:hypothetical protein n=1 Tax=Lysobacter capsici TaxID=435897 RepID=UPI00398CDB0B
MKAHALFGLLVVAATAAAAAVAYNAGDGEPSSARTQTASSASASPRSAPAGAGSLAPSGAASMTDTAATTYRFVDKLIDSSDDNNHYAYAPSIVVENGVFHMFYCSFGNGGWDDVRYSTSPDGRRWSAPVVVLTTTDSVNERATCDPSVVKYQAPGDSQPYYYLFYSGNKLHTQTVMFVARATNVGGPYSKWTTDHTWVPNAPNPKIIIGPAVPKPDASGWYGAGQQSVVVRNGQLVSWYTDDTTCANAPCNRLFTSTTTNPTAWPAGTQIDVQGQRSVDVKYDPQLDKYVMFYIGNEHDQTSYLVRRYSQNGVNWDQPETLCDTACFPDWTHNPGVSGTVAGQLIDGRALVAYGAPYDLHPSYDNGDCAVSAHSPYCWGRWDLYGSVINPKGEVWNAIPWGWQWNAMSTNRDLALGDYDGDGKTDRAIVDRATSRWYVISSSGQTVVPWGWQWNQMDTAAPLALGDYDATARSIGPWPTRPTVPGTRSPAVASIRSPGAGTGTATVRNTTWRWATTMATARPIGRSSIASSPVGM